MPRIKDLTAAGAAPDADILFAGDDPTAGDTLGYTASEIVGASAISGPGSSTDNSVVRFDGATGTIIQGSAIIIDDSNNVSGVGNITFSGNLIGTIASSSTTIDCGTI